MQCYAFLQSRIYCQLLIGRWKNIDEIRNKDVRIIKNFVEREILLQKFVLEYIKQDATLMKC